MEGLWCPFLWWQMAFQVLNRLKWTGRLGESRVVILHRGAPGDRKSIPGSCIVEVKKGYFLYRADSPGGQPREGRETFIPNHRIREIWMGSSLVWKRREGA